jgi:ketosteroid isomerase-like protein
MMAPVDVVREFYAKLTAGDAPGALALMADDIEWITMMDYKIDGCGPQKVFDGMLLPAMQEWEPYTLTPNEFICDGDKVDYSHIWEVKDGKIQRHRQFIDTGKIEPARRPG